MLANYGAEGDLPATWLCKKLLCLEKTPTSFLRVYALQIKPRHQAARDAMSPKRKTAGETFLSAFPGFFVSWGKPASLRDICGSTGMVELVARCNSSSTSGARKFKRLEGKLGAIPTPPFPQLLNQRLGMTKISRVRMIGVVFQHRLFATRATPRHAAKGTFTFYAATFTLSSRPSFFIFFISWGRVAF